MLEPHFKNIDWVSDSEKPLKRANSESAPGHNLNLKPKKAHFSKQGQNRDKINLLSYMKMIPYTKPKIYKSGAKWHIEYHFNIPYELQDLPEYAGKKRKRFKVYENINRLHGEEKEIFAEWLRDQRELMLVNGYNPFNELVEHKEYLQQEKIKEEIKSEPLYTILDKYLKAKIVDGISVKSVQSYTTPINHIKAWMDEKGYQGKSADDFTEDDILLYLSERATTKKWTAWTYNINREFAFMWFNWMESNKIITKSPLTKRLTKRIESGVSKNESYHGRIRETVSNALKDHPVIDRFCKLVYYTCSRPQEETLYIKIADINIEQRTIKIYEQGKGGSRHIPVSDELHDLLINEFKINDYPTEYYLASKDCLPGIAPVSKNYYSERFRKIKRELNIPDMYGIYSWKHTRINDLLSNGYSDAEVIQLTGHKGTESYDTYKRSVGKHLESRIKGKTVSF